MRQKINELKQHYYICYTLLFLIMCIVVFGVFWYNGKSFVCCMDTEDGLTQHYTAYLYYGRYLRSIIKSIFIDHTFSIPAFSMSIGYGSDILTTLSYYVIGDPICFLTVFVPTKYMLYFYDFSILLRLFLAGITFSKLCFYINEKRNTRYSNTAVMIGTFIYVFCGYALIASVRHPYFTNPMIYFPLVLLGVEMILDKKKPYVFTISVFLSSISNFYFFYMIVILTVLYVVWRLIFKYHRNEIKEAFHSLGEITGYSILGTAMSAVILIPTIIVFVGDARNESEYLYSIFYTLEDYQKSISGFIGVNTYHDWVTFGYAAVALIAVFLLFMQKGKYKNIKVAFIGMILMISLPIVGRIMNGGSYVSNRWIWAFSLMIGYIVVIMWDQLLAASLKEKWRLFLCLCGYFILCMVMTQSRTDDFFIPMIIAFAFLCLLIFREGKYKAIITTGCIICVFANIGINALIEYSPRFNNYIDEFADNKNFTNNYNQTEANVLRRLSPDIDDTFSRYTGSVTLNRTLNTGLHSTQYFWSLSNRNISDFQLETGLNFDAFSRYSGLDGRAGLTTLANVKYFVKKDTETTVAPYGYESIGSGTDYNLSDYLTKNIGQDYDGTVLSEEEKQSLTEEYLTTYDVYENENALPFGYTYSDYITRESYDKLTPIQKQEAMLQTVVLEGDEGDSEMVPTITSESVSYTVEEKHGLQWQDNKIIVTEENAEAKINFIGMENAETYIYIKGLDYTGFSPVDRYTDTEWAAESTYDKNTAKYEERFWKEPDTFSLNFSSENIDGQTSKASIIYKTPYNRYYSNQKDYLINLYYDDLSRRSITIKFPTIGTYTYDDLEVLCQPMDNYDEQIDGLKADTLENVDFYDDNAVFATSKVTGNISLDQGKYLLLTIPYSSGWTAYVDGKEQDLLKANTMYMALKLDAGEHSIELRYHTPGLTVGLCTSLAAFAVFILIFAFSKRKDKAAINKGGEGSREGDEQ